MKTHGPTLSQTGDFYLPHWHQLSLSPFATSATYSALHSEVQALTQQPRRRRRKKKNLTFNKTLNSDKAYKQE